MVSVKIINDNIDSKKEDSQNEIEIDGKKMTVAEYNDSILSHPILKKFNDLGGDKGYFGSKLIEGKSDYHSVDEYIKEIAKRKRVNLNL